MFLPVGHAAQEAWSSAALAEGINKVIATKSIAGVAAKCWLALGLRVW